MKAVSGTSNPAAVQFKDFAGNSQLELWAVRVPDGVRSFPCFPLAIQACADPGIWLQVKPSALDGLVLNLPSGSKHATGAIGRFTPKKSSTEYEIFLADEEQTEVGQKRKRAEESEDHGGDEMKSLVPLLPDRTRGDKHYAGQSSAFASLCARRAPPLILRVRQLPKPSPAT